MLKHLQKIFILITIAIGFANCGEGGLNLFSVQDDATLGAQIDQEIQSDPSMYPLLDEETNSSAYDYLETIRDKILASDEIQHQGDFAWRLHIVQDDSVLNAFATSGGYLYFYTGLLKFLDKEDDLAGVMAHEIAHADRRHTTEALTRQYGTTLLLDAVLGDNQNILTDIALGLADLSYSRSNESEADAFSVHYLSDTEYQCNGAAGFFEKILAEDGDSGVPEFLSTHPDPGDRVSAINSEAEMLNCSTTPSGNNYEAFKQLLP